MFAKYSTKIKPLYYILIICLFSSCYTHKQMIYFGNNINKVTTPDSAKSAFVLKIYPNDILSVQVFGSNPETIEMLTSGVLIPSDIRSPYERAYVVDNNGNIDLPILGRMNVAGMSIIEAKEAIKNKGKEYFDNPVVNVKKLSFKITLLGEFTKPGQYIIQNEKITLVEAIGLAGDLTFFGNRTNIKIIRSNGPGGKIQFIDLTTNSSIFPEPLYLYPDDVVYVEPIRRKTILNISPEVTIISSLLTATVVLLSFIYTRTK